MSCIVKSSSHPEREIQTCETMALNVVLTLQVVTFIFLLVSQEQSDSGIVSACFEIR